MGILSKLFGSSSRVKTETLGVLDLMEGGAAAQIAADTAALGPLFTRTETSTESAPKSTCLLVYCRIDEAGRIDGYAHSLREIIRDAGAPLVVVATPNTQPAYSAATPERPYGHANLVMTLDRQGASFPRFFQRLITEMKKGQTFPAAWVGIAPQGPGTHHDVPMTFAIAERGDVTFE